MNALYTRDIIRLAAQAPSGGLSRPDVSVTKTSRICGSTITIDVNIKDGRVTGYGQKIKACALGQASSAIVAANIIGKTRDDIAPVAEGVEKLLKEDGPAPKGEWAAYEKFIPARDHPARHSAIMLPFEALREAFKSNS